MSNCLFSRDFALKEIIASRIGLVKGNQIAGGGSQISTPSGILDYNIDIALMTSRFFHVSYRNKINSELLACLLSANLLTLEAVHYNVDEILVSLKNDNYEKKWYDWLRNDNNTFFNQNYLFPSIVMRTER